MGCSVSARSTTRCPGATRLRSESRRLRRLVHRRSTESAPADSIEALTKGDGRTFAIARSRTTARSLTGTEGFGAPADRRACAQTLKIPLRRDLVLVRAHHFRGVDPRRSLRRPRQSSRRNRGTHAQLVRSRRAATTWAVRGRGAVGRERPVQVAAERLAERRAQARERHDHGEHGRGHGDGTRRAARSSRIRLPVMYAKPTSVDTTYNEAALGPTSRGVAASRPRSRSGAAHPCERAGVGRRTPGSLPSRPRRTNRRVAALCSESASVPVTCR